MGRFGRVALLGAACWRMAVSLSAAVGDENCLLQRERMGPALLPAFANSRMARLARQLPSGDALDKLANTGLDNTTSYMALAAYAMDFINLFRNDTVVDTMYSVVRNVTYSLGNHSVSLAADADQLYEDAMNTSKVSVEGVFARLSKFLSEHESALARIAADLVIDGRDLIKLLPPGKIHDTVWPAIKFTDRMTSKEIYNWIFDVLLWPTTQPVVANRTGFCTNFRGTFYNFSAMDEALTEQAGTFLTNSHTVLSQCSDLLSSLGQEKVVFQIMGFANTTLDGLEDLLLSYNNSLRHYTETLRKVSNARLGCKWVWPPQSSAASRAGSGLGALALLAAVAWAWLSAA